jgi:NADPH:quinone reductase-like Zn-dependent oxidoreductase
VKVVRIRAYGGPDVLEMADVPAPTPADDEVVVRVKATSVNPVDWLVRDGAAKSFVRVSFPVILGCDLAGEIVEVGPKATRHAVGDEVFAMMPHDWGAHAERVALPERFVVAKPVGLGMIEAASLPVVALTAWNGLQKRARVTRGERVLVNGASGGVGLAAIQIAKALGASVTAVCGGASAELVKRVGADEVIDYKTSDFTRGEARYDVVFDCVGNRTTGECARVLRGKRVYLTTTPRLSTFVRQFFNPLFAVKVFGLITKGSGEDLESIKRLVEEGRLKPVIDKVFPLAEVAAAQEYSKSGRAKGKIVLEVA